MSELSEKLGIASHRLPDGRVAVRLVGALDDAGAARLIAHQSASDRLRFGTVHLAVQRVLEITALLDVFAPTDDFSTPTRS